MKGKQSGREGDALGRKPNLARARVEFLRALERYVESTGKVVNGARSQAQSIEQIRRTGDRIEEGLRPYRIR